MDLVLDLELHSMIPTVAPNEVDGNVHGLRDRGLDHCVAECPG